VFGTQRAVFIVDEAGIVRYRHVHTLSLDYENVDELREALERVRAEAPATKG
jgi:alkyl hydroperoxide reductase subunit AhpC